MASTRGFDHLPLIAKSIHELYRTFGAPRIRGFMTNFMLASLANHVRRDPIIGTQHLARRIAEIYGLPVTTVIVTYSTTLVPPGRVELSQSNEFFVELQSQLKSEPRSVAAILAHEVAHIFLHRCGVRFSDEFENEVLTDTTAAYLGFGSTILNAATETKTRLGDVIQTRTHHFGYLTLDEFGYIQAKRDYVFGMNATAEINESFPLSGFINGKRRFGLERKSRPYTRSLRQHILCFVRRFIPFLERTQSSETKALRFLCICCSQKLRIPNMGKQLSVRCPTCESKHICFS